MKAIVNKLPSDSNESGNPAFNFIIVRDDGTEVMRSSRYKSKDSAYKGVRAVKKNCNDNNRYTFRTAPDGKHSFEIKAANGIPVVGSVGFSSEHEMLENVKSIKTQIPDCEIDFKKNY